MVSVACAMGGVGAYAPQSHSSASIIFRLIVIVYLYFTINSYFKSMLKLIFLNPNVFSDFSTQQPRLDKKAKIKSKVFTVIFVDSNYAKGTITYWLMQMFILCVAYEWKYT